MWIVTVTLDGALTQDGMERLEDALGVDAAVAAIPDEAQTTVTVEWNGPTEDAAAATLAQILPHARLPVVRVDIATFDDYKRRAGRPTVPEMVGAAEAAEILGVSRQRIHQLHAAHPSFPAPLVQVRMGPLWDRRAVEAFTRTWERKPGRPKIAACT